MADRLASDVDQRDKCIVDSLDFVVKGISESLDGRMTNLKGRTQHQRETFERKWEDKIVQLEPGSKEGTISLAEHRIRTSVQTEMEKTWMERMEKEDKINTNKVRDSELTSRTTESGD